MEKGQILAHASWFLEVFELDQLTPKKGRKQQKNVCDFYYTLTWFWM